MEIDKYRNKIICGDCIEEMRKLPENSVDVIVTDFPYGLENGFMSSEWDNFKSDDDYFNFCYECGKESLRVLKSGGFMLAFSSTKNYDIMVYALRKSGYEIRDQLIYAFGTGFPKATDISKGIDKYYGKLDEREIIGLSNSKGLRSGSNKWVGDNYDHIGYNITKPYTKEAKMWGGYRSALKPAFEPIVLCRKPKEGTYVENVLKYRTGGLNIDECRISYINKQDKNDACSIRPNALNGYDHTNGIVFNKKPDSVKRGDIKGRYPSNLLLDQESAKLLDEQWEISKSGKIQYNENVNRKGFSNDSIFNYKTTGFKPEDSTGICNYGDSGGVSRYFKRFFYTKKVSKFERNAGLDELEDKIITDGRNKSIDNPFNRGESIRKNEHPTVKPINLMRYLVRLISPPKQLKPIILDCFFGSGSTGIACVIEGYDYIGIEMNEKYCKIAKKRIKYWSNPINWKYLKYHNLLPKPMSKKIKQKGLL